MKITLIGTGNVGTNLAAAFREAGHEVVWLRGRDFRTEEVGGDIVVVSVRDEALPSVAERLRDVGSPVVHTAGSVLQEVLKCPRRGVFYPMQTFTKERIIRFTDVPVFIESATDLPLLEQLARSISNRVFVLDGEGRKHLHLAAVFACNFANHCYALSETLLRKHGIPFDVMLPLIDETAGKVHALSPRKAQTGPAVRQDVSVMERQEAMLTGRLREIYRLMSESIHELNVNQT